MRCLGLNKKTLALCPGWRQIAPAGSLIEELLARTAASDSLMDTICLLSDFANVFDISLQRQRIQSADWENGQQRYAAVQNAEDVGKGFGNLIVGPLNGRWVFDPPVRGHWLPRPNGARLARSLVTNREYKIEFGCAGSRKFVPRFAAQMFCREPVALDEIERNGIDRARMIAACAERLEASVPQVVEQSFGHDAARRVAGANKEHVVFAF